MAFKENLKKFFGVYDDEPVAPTAPGWAAKDVKEEELVDDEWIKKNTKEVK